MRIPLALCAAALGVVAAAPLSSVYAADCANAQDQATMNECAGNAFKTSDDELNKLYKQIRSRLKDDPDTTKLLVAAQRAWVAYRDAECNFQSSKVLGGSVYPMIAAMCLTGETQHRVAAFKSYLQCTDDDMSCPVPGAN